MFARALALALLPIALAYGAKTPPSTAIEEPLPAPEETYPWFTGSLLSFASEVIPVGYINLETYFQVFDSFGQYNKHWHGRSIPNILSISPFIFFQIGLTEWMDFAIYPQMIYNKSQGHSYANLADLNAGLDFQLLTEKEDSWRPAIKLIFLELFPTGKYQNLNPKKKGTDITGRGSYQSTLGVAVGKLIHFTGVHYLATRFNALYTYAAPVHVRGFNAYGGGFGTSGTAKPGATFNAIAAAEYSLTKHWALAIDIDYIHTDRSRFRGKRGVDAFGLPASVSIPSSEQFSLAPAIEYSFSENLGIVAGSWFTVAGRNSSQFVSGIIALNWYAKISSDKAQTHTPFPGGGGGSR